MRKTKMLNREPQRKRTSLRAMESSMSSPTIWSGSGLSDENIAEWEGKFCIFALSYQKHTNININSRV